jgi:AraC family transcriptional regulator of adaptative response / DNA-3-methyladenine glycosylase II
MTVSCNKQALYKAHLTRDARFDGKFFVAVKTTKIYCRPICPARKAKLENLTFYLHAAQAEDAGYRPCLRCRPETAPGSAAWLGTSTTVKRALRLLEQFAAENLSIEQLANKLGIGERWLRELFQIQVGVTPQRLLLDNKLNIARNLLEHSSQSITDIAFSSGFNSVRRFNDAFKKRFANTPSNFKKYRSINNVWSLYLSFRPPFAWQTLLAYLKARQISSMELSEENAYQRLIHYQGEQAWLRASLADNNKLKIEFRCSTTVNMLGLVTKVKDMFDLDSDPMLIENDLKQDKKLKPLIEAHPGLRIPGCWDGFELAVRAIIGQLISVKAATTILTRLVMHCGHRQNIDPHLSLTHFFPEPKDILGADLSRLGLTKAKEKAIQALAQAIVDNKVILDGSQDYEQTCRNLLAIRGIGPWTVQYIAMRALKNPDAFPEKDLELQKRISQFELEPSKWSPWRAYAATLLFNL